MFKHSALIAVLLVFVVVTSGCINIDPEALAKAHPIVNQFLRDHPNADLRIIHYSAEEAEGIIDRIREDCAKDTIEPKEFYLVNVTDIGYHAYAWIDWEAQVIECAFKFSDVVDPECVSKAKAQCYGDHVYWFDSCGNKESKKQYCEEGCLNGVCISSGNQIQCKSKAEYKCYGEHVYWFDSCGHKQDKKEYCNYGCDNGFCKNKTYDEKCYDSDGGKNFQKQGVVEAGNQRLEDHCNNDGTLTEKYCDGDEAKAMIYECPYGCLEGACLNETA